MAVAAETPLNDSVSPSIACHRLDAASRSDRQAVHAFYRSQRYRARCKSNETLLALVTSPAEAIVAAVRLSHRPPCPLLGSSRRVVCLRSLCVSSRHRRCGLGTRLAAAAIAHASDAATAGDAANAGGAATAGAALVYCMCEPPLVPLYEAAGMHECAEPAAEAPSPSIAAHYDRVAKQQMFAGRQQVRLMLSPLAVAPSSAADEAVAPSSVADEASMGELVRIVLVQHPREARRATATAPLLSHASLASHVRVVATLEWGGRAYNEKVVQALAALPRPVLLCLIRPTR